MGPFSSPVWLLSEQLIATPPPALLGPLQSASINCHSNATATLRFYPAQLPGTQPMTSFSKPPLFHWPHILFFFFGPTFLLLFPGAPEAPYTEQFQGAGRKAKEGTEAIGTRHLGRQGCREAPQWPYIGVKVRHCKVSPAWTLG